MAVKTQCYLLAIIMTAISSALAQAPDIEWIQYYDFNIPNECWDMIQTSDSGYALIGTAGDTLINADVFLIKTDGYGDTLWTRSYGGDLVDAGRSIRQTSDGGYIIAGFTTSFGAGGRDLYLIKADSTGDTVWTRTFGGVFDEEGRCVQLVGNNAYAIAGWTSSFGLAGDDFYLVKTDTAGGLIWEKTFGTTNDARAWSLALTPAGHYAMLGWVGNYNSNMYFVLANDRGNQISAKSYGDSGSDEGRAIINVNYADYENFILCGKYTSYSNPYICVMRVTTMGYIMWERLFYIGTIGHCIARTSDGGYIVGGYSASDNVLVYIVKTGSDGNEQWTKYVTIESAAKVRAIRQASDGGYAFAGNDVDLSFLVKLSLPQGGIDEHAGPIPDDISLCQNNPNPFNSETRISFSLRFDADIDISIYNIEGKFVYCLLRGYHPAGEHSLTWDASDLPSGIYFARLHSNNGAKSIKILLIK